MEIKNTSNTPRDKDRILHIIDAINFINDFLEGKSYDDLVRDVMLQSAVVRQLEIIGEAAKSMSEETRNKVDGVPWTEIAGMRNRIIHEYFEINLSVVWNTYLKDLPQLKVQMEELIKMLNG